MAGVHMLELTAPSRSARRNMLPNEANHAEDAYTVDPRLHRRTLRKLDGLLLPFLALLFLFNALDKANVSRDEPGHGRAR
jgi:hypothetical protein